MRCMGEESIARLGVRPKLLVTGAMLKIVHPTLTKPPSGRTQPRRSRVSKSCCSRGSRDGECAVIAPDADTGNNDRLTYACREIVRTDGGDGNCCTHLSGGCTEILSGRNHPPVPRPLAHAP